MIKMLPQQEEMIYKHFIDLVRDCDLVKIMKGHSLKDHVVTKIIDNVKLESDRRHNNRCILFEILKSDSSTIFHTLVLSLRQHELEDLADRLENKPIILRPKHMTCCIQMPDEIEGQSSNIERLKIEVKYASTFCDNEEYSYRTRSRNRGQVLIINNMHFDTEHHKTRKGSEVDESNLKDLFERIGFNVDMYRNLTTNEMKTIVEKFSRGKYECAPDMGIVIIMSHGEKINNNTVIIGSDGLWIEEEWIMRQFNNKTCPLFKNKPKILIFNICRGELVDNLSHFAQHTQSDSACTKRPDYVDGDERYYSDLMICHPSVEGFQAHRDTIRGCWYIELICKVFMENSYKTDVESMFKMVERDLKNRISEKMTRQTSTVLNIAFKTCFLNPGIYEEDGVLMKFKQSL